jgi:hypothetical protein
VQFPDAAELTVSAALPASDSNTCTRSRSSACRLAVSADSSRARRPSDRSRAKDVLQSDGLQLAASRQFLDMGPKTGLGSLAAGRQPIQQAPAIEFLDTPDA